MLYPIYIVETRTEYDMFFIGVFPIQTKGSFSSFMCAWVGFFFFFKKWNYQEDAGQVY